MRAHVFATSPRYCLACKPAIIRVRCPKCGHPHSEYFGPENLDEREAENAFLRAEVQRLAALIGSRNDEKPRRERSLRRGH